MKIELKSFDLRNEKILKQHEFFLELLDDRMRFSFNCDVEKPIIENDPDSGFNKSVSYALCVAKKDKVTAFDMLYSENPEKFGIYISVMGTAEDIKFFFEEKKEALKVFAQIEKWLFNETDFAGDILSKIADKEF